MAFSDAFWQLLSDFLRGNKFVSKVYFEKKDSVTIGWHFIQLKAFGLI